MQDEQYSPIFSQYTQEGNENIDVVWDWNSPQSRPRTFKHKLRNAQNSPKLPVKRHPSNNQIDVFNKLKEELETLKSLTGEHSGSELNKLDSIEQNELNYKVNETNLDDIFNDSMEEQLLICSQKAEIQLQANNNFSINNSPVECSSNSNSPEKQGTRLSRILFRDDLQTLKLIENDNCKMNDGSRNTKNTVKNNMLKFPNDNASRIADDSFDFLLGTLNDEDLELNKPNVHYNKRLDETLPPAQPKELNDKNQQQCTVEEIERKRNEALAKLETKKKQTSNESESPIKCSPEEIEQKRLQAKAKLEAKKKLDIIERNRQEALKRLELNKKKRVLQANGVLHK